MSKQEHGTETSYVVGFILSLIFTIIPYYMVMNKTVTGTALLATILGFALVQMFVQIFFFLHLGRGPKPLYNVVFFVFTAGAIAVVVLGSIFIMNNLHYNMSTQEITKKLAQDEGIDQIGGQSTGACQDLGENHQIIIKNGKPDVEHIDAKLCDTLSFINQDDQTREIAFGPHDEHQSYGGETELLLRKGHSKTLTLNEEGTVTFHDHLEDEVTGTFTVAR